MSNIDLYAQEVPNEIRSATEGLAGDTEYGIIVLLLKEGPQPFTKIKNELDLHQGKLSKSLDRLQDGGIIVKNESTTRDNRYKGKYEVSEYGKRILDGLYDAIQPREVTSLPILQFNPETQWGQASDVYQLSITNEQTAIETSLDEATDVSGGNNVIRRSAEP